jgi:hypothetical protein
MTICKVYELEYRGSVGECDIGVCIWFGAPIMHRISCLSFALHLHVVCVHVHLSSHYGTMESSGLLLKLHMHWYM